MQRPWVAGVAWELELLLLSSGKARDAGGRAREQQRMEEEAMWRWSVGGLDQIWGDPERVAAALG